MGQSEKMEQEDNRPKWLLELENRKRKPRLAHEVGAGAPCMTCSTACPGLDLHFWRKICKNCKCSRDDHDVPNDEFPQFDLLFGPSGKPNRKMIVLKVNKKQSEDEVTFEWAPPDTTKELAADYMKALPEDKLPIKGSAGAALRKQQLQRQIPLHDIDHKVCDELSESERKQFEKYLENLKKYVGQGKVMKAMGARPFDRSLMTPANATDMNRFSPKHKQNQTEIGHSLNLRTPSSFVQKTTYPSTHGPAELTNGLVNRNNNSPSRDQCPISSARMETIRSPAFGNSSNENSPQGRYHRALANIRNDGEITSSEPVGGARNSPLNFARTCRNTSDKACDTLSSDNEGIDRRRLENSSDARNASTINSESSGTIYNPAVEFAASNMMGDMNRETSPFLEKSENSVKADSKDNRGFNYAMSGTIVDREIARTSAGDSKLHSPAKPKSLIPSSLLITDSSSSILDEPNDHDNDDDDDDNDEAIARNRQRENSLLAEKMLNEALLPPSAINSADIIGSTLDERGLSFIREKLASKYSAKEEPVNLQGSTRSREFTKDDKKDIGARTKRADQLRRQGAFDKESERNDVIATARNPSGIVSTDEQFPIVNLADNSSLGMENSPEGHNNVAGMINHQAKSNYPQDTEIESREIKMPVVTAFKDNSANEPWRQIVRGICDNYLAKPGKSCSEVEIKNDQHNIDKNNSNVSGFNENSHFDPAASCKSLRAELSNYGPGNSNVVRSEDLHNPVFPEQARVSSGIVQNPVNVDLLRGAIEELSVGQSKMENCHKCRESIRAGDVVVTAEKANDAFWHPGCFVCSVCNELLADLVYFYYKGKLYCGRDLATLLEIPRCFACDELIFVREYTVAEGHSYHVKHFCCWDCDVPLAGQQYISENDRPLCLPCYQRTYAKTCRTCDGLIDADQQGVAVKNLDFHANDSCFCCATCKKSLLNGKMAIKEDRPFCSKECITKFMNERIN